MKLNCFKTISTFMFVVFFTSITADNYSFSNYSIDQGLSNSSVVSIVQDKKGYMWVATQDGLNRYDSYQFEQFRNTDNDEHSLVSNSIFTVHLNQNGELWIGTKNGLSRYNYKNKNFDNFLQDSQSCYVTDIVEKDNHTLILVDRFAISFFDTENYTCRRVQLFKPKRQNIYSSLLISPIELLLGTSDGLFVYNIHRKVLRRITPSLSNERINCMKVAKNGYWIGTENKGLYKLDDSFKVIKIFGHSPSNSNVICNNQIRCLSFDSQSNLWIGTYQGISIINSNEEVTQSFVHNELNNESIAQNSIRCITSDNQGGIWIGTYYGGINYTNPLKDKFGKIKAMPFGKGLNDKVISAISEDSQGDLWIGTNDNGINIFNKKTNGFKYFNTESPTYKGLLSNNIKTILMISPTSALIGTHKGGVTLLDKNKGVLKYWTAQNSGLGSDVVRHIIKVKENEYWIATLNGLRIFNGATFDKISNPELNKLLGKRAINYLYKSSKNVVWIGCTDGFISYSLNTKQTILFEKIIKLDIRKMAVNVISEDSKGSIWIGTTKGILVINANKKISRWTTRNGLPNDYVYGILATDREMWISTNHGLARFNTTDSLFRTFSTLDGLQSNQFTEYSFHKTSKGELYFGGINGINHFFSENLINNPFSPAPVINNIKLFNKIVIPQDQTGILDESIENKTRLKLKHNQNSINICFVTLNYLSSQHNTYRYKLDGFDQDWLTTTQREVTYSNLEPGKYTFHLKSKNNDNKWSNNTAQLEIKIAPPWWSSWWAIILWLVLFVAIVYTVFRVMIMREKMEHQLHLEKLEKIQNNELHELQLRYFVNISHEFRTPLTLILVPIQELLEKEIENPWVKQQIRYVYKNTQKLLHLVNLFLNYRKAELGFIPLKTSMTEVTPLLYDIYLMFEKLAKQKNIDFDFESKVDGKRFQIDLNYVERIVSNLLSNAFKNTPNSGAIAIKVYEQSANLVIEIVDTGAGIPKQVQNMIFDRFYQVEQNQYGTGIGLSLVKRLVSLHHGNIELVSDEGQGAKFKVILPQNANEYSDKETTSETAVLNSEQIDMEISTLEEGISDNYSDGNYQYTLLIVDDNNDMLNYLKDTFSSSFNILTAKDGQQGLDSLKDNSVDLIITDVMMPVMDGITFCNKVKRNIKYSHIPVIILTAKDDSLSEEQGITMGADDYIPKPFVISILRAKVSNILSMREKVRSHYQSGEKVQPENLAFSSLDKEFLSKSFNIVNENLDNINFGVEEFSKALAISRTGAQQKLRAIVGESVVEFIRRIRIEKSAELLKTGRYSIAEISTMVGYNTPSYFTVSFKKHFNCLPTEYIKDIQMKP